MTDFDKNTAKSQRKVLGWLCFLLAPCSLLFGLFGLSTNNSGWYCSISDTYYANDKAIMIGVLAITAFYFFIYKGYDIRDRVVNITSAVCALGVIFFPCSNSSVEFTGLFNLPIALSVQFHIVSAGCLFYTFAYNCAFMFTEGDKANDRKRLRNIVYYVCAVLISLSVFGIIATTNLLHFSFGVWICEAVALTSYAVAWWTKAGCFKFLNDKE